jgi:tetratricopeptide (TPR) repeat protein
MERVLSDQAGDFTHARSRLTRLLTDQPHSRSLHGALALLSAHLWARFSGSTEMRKDAETHATRAGRSEPNAGLAAVLVHWASGEVELAQQHLGRLPSDAHNWHWRLCHTNLLLTPSSKRIASAREALRAETKSPRPSVAMLYLAARTFRLTREYELAREAAGRGGPRHLGLQIERTLLTLARGTTIPTDSLASLQSAPLNASRSRGSLAVLNSRIAWAKGQAERAAKWAQQAKELMPLDVEAQWLSARSLLLPGGDASAALRALEQHDHAGLGLYHPAYRLPLIEASLLAGYAEKALEVYRRTAPAALTPRERRLATALHVYALHAMDDDLTLQRVCTPAALPKDDPGRIPCREVLYQRSEVSSADRLALPAMEPAVASYLDAHRSLALGNARRAIQLLRQFGTNRRLPDPQAPALALGAAYQAEGDLRRAERTLRKAVAADAQSIRSRVALAGTLIQAGKRAEARQVLDNIRPSSINAPLLSSMAGEQFLRLGDVERAKELTGPLLLRRFGHSRSLQLLAAQVASVERRHREAQALYHAVLKSHPDDFRAHLGLGQLESQLGDPSKAREHLGATLIRRPKDPAILLTVALEFARMKQYPLAVVHGQHAIRLFSGSGQGRRAFQAKISLGQILAAGDHKARHQALRLLRDLARSSDAPAVVFLALGRIHQASGGTRKAADSYRQAIKRDPGLAPAHFHLGMLLKGKRAHWPEARQVLERYLKLRPNGPRAKRASQALKAIAPAA